MKLACKNDNSNNDDIIHKKLIFILLSFITTILIFSVESLSFSSCYALTTSHNKDFTIKNQLQLQPQLHKRGQHVLDDNAFSDISRNMTSSSGDGGQALAGNVISNANSIGPNLATGDRNSNSADNIGRGGTSGNDISSGSIFTQHGSSSSSPHYHSSGSSSGSIPTQHGYQLTVNVSPYPFGTSTVGISITTANGYADQANVATAGVASWIFNIPPNQGNWVRACVNSENSSGKNCNTYDTTGTDMSVSLFPVTDNSNGDFIYRGLGGFSGHHVGSNHGFGKSSVNP
ncbi:MAG: hypothetical protein WAM14_06635 [Candidatus Nitrosopolaris sp.]